LSSGSYNELNFLTAKKVEKANVRQLKLAKYFPIILDCTPDVSHHEQMSVILRYVQFDREKERLGERNVFWLPYLNFARMQRIKSFFIL